MSTIQCPACAEPIRNDLATCPRCGKPVTMARPLSRRAPITRTDGKILAVGTVLVASALIATVAGTWWGPALLFPGAAVFILGKFWA